VNGSIKGFVETNGSTPGVKQGDFKGRDITPTISLVLQKLCDSMPEDIKEISGAKIHEYHHNHDLTVAVTV